MSTSPHIPVMCQRVVALLAPALQHPGAVYVDATLGLGGHAQALLEACPQARLVGVDRDPAALDHSRDRLAAYGDRVQLVRAVYDELPRVLAELGVRRIDACLFDLGLSSLQIDDPSRGFSYAQPTGLDMRMSGADGGLTAAEVVNTYSAAELAHLLRVYGDERFATRIADAIVSARQEAPLTDSGRLVEVITAAIPAAARHSGGHPAKRSYQALRIEVNAERQSLEAALPAALAGLALQGRIVVLSYHSGEDRFVKKTLTKAAQDDVPANLIEVPADRQAQFQLLTQGAEKPCQAELAANPRSASARLRAAVRIKEAA